MTAQTVGCAALSGGRLAMGTSVGRYTVLEPVGSGTMGHVYAAYDPDLDRRVALKLLRSELAGDSRALIHEAQAMAKLTHSNVVAVHDVGLVEGSEPPQLFVAMQFVPGGTLREWSASKKRSPEEVIAIFLQAGRGSRRPIARAWCTGTSSPTTCSWAPTVGSGSPTLDSRVRPRSSSATARSSPSAARAPTPSATSRWRGRGARAARCCAASAAGGHGRARARAAAWLRARGGGARQPTCPQSNFGASPPTGSATSSPSSSPCSRRSTAGDPFGDAPPRRSARRCARGGSPLGSPSSRGASRTRWPAACPSSPALASRPWRPCSRPSTIAAGGRGSARSRGWGRGRSRWSSACGSSTRPRPAGASARRRCAAPRRGERSTRCGVRCSARSSARP
ncbi:serine/threonine kinase family protein [Plesiocystis pacifica SIR-1]|uniref:Serine/threonine kinase family protein n=1 Tax=Plesiocystis pacifica SIR-1 TaxID=391625 RepID=A6G679_9BACT|nr:serine/threonine kinase family protein [Plesiocystis pacifica SIR-1]